MNRNDTGEWQYLIVFAVVALALAGLYAFNRYLVVDRVGLQAFLLNWNSLQRFIYDGTSPYSTAAFSDTTRLIIQRGYVTGAISDQHMMLPYLLFYLPFSWIQTFEISASIWLMVLELSLVGAFVLIYERIEWRFPFLFILPIVVFFLAWEPVWASFNSGSDIFIQIFLILLSLKMVQQNSDEYAGVLIAFSFINLETFGILFLTYFLWLIVKRRWGVLGGFLLTTFLMQFLAYIFSAGWYLEYLRNQLAFWRGNDLLTTKLIFTSWLPAVGATFGHILSVLALATMLFEWQNISLRDENALYWVLCLTLPIVPLLGISYKSEWLLSAMPALALVSSRFTNRWHLLGYVLSIVYMLFIGIALWLAAAYDLPSVQMVFFPLSLVLMMYWVRWDSVKKPRLWVDELAKRQ